MERYKSLFQESTFSVGVSRISDLLSSGDKNRIKKLKRWDAIGTEIIMALEFSDASLVDIMDWISINKPELSKKDLDSLESSLSKHFK